MTTTATTARRNDKMGEYNSELFVAQKGLKDITLNTIIISEMTTTDQIKARIHEDIELNHLFLDMFDEPLTPLENQIIVNYMSLRNCPIYDTPKSRFLTQAEKIRVLVKEWKRIRLIPDFALCDLYRKEYKLKEDFDLSDDDYNILAIKYIVKMKLW
jgi:hypothetical protein